MDSSDIFDTDAAAAGQRFGQFRYGGPMPSTDIDAITFHPLGDRRSTTRVARSVGGSIDAGVFLTGPFPRKFQSGDGVTFQKRLALLCQNGQGSGDFLQGDSFVASLVLFQNRLVRFDVGMLSRLVDLVVELLYPLLVDLSVAGDFHRLDRLPRFFLDQPQFASFAGAHHQDGFAASSGAAGSADPMDIDFAVIGGVVVDHMADSLHIESTGCYVGSDNDLDPMVLQAIDHPLALALRDFPMQRSDAKTTFPQVVGQRFAGHFGADENQHSIGRLRFQQSGQHGRTILVGDHHVALAHRIGGGRLLSDFDVSGILEMLTGDPPDRFRHRRRKQSGLMASRSLIQDPFDVIGESHFQHFVGFIEHQALEGVEHQRASPHVVHDATRGTNDDLGAAIQLPKLNLIVLTAIDTGDRDSPHLRGIFRVGIGYLDCQFTRGRQNQDLYGRDFGIEPMEGG